MASVNKSIAVTSPARDEASGALSASRASKTSSSSANSKSNKPSSTTSRPSKSTRNKGDCQSCICSTSSTSGSTSRPFDKSSSTGNTQRTLSNSSGPTSSPSSTVTSSSLTRKSLPRAQGSPSTISTKSKMVSSTSNETKSLASSSAAKLSAAATANIPTKLNDLSSSQSNSFKYGYDTGKCSGSALSDSIRTFGTISSISSLSLSETNNLSDTSVSLACAEENYPCRESTISIPDCTSRVGFVQIEQVKINNDLRVKIAENEEKINLLNCKNKKYQKSYEYLTAEHEALQCELHENYKRRENVEKENELLSTENVRLVQEVKTLKREAQQLQELLKLRLSEMARIKDELEKVNCEFRQAYANLCILVQSDQNEVLFLQNCQNGLENKQNTTLRNFEECKELLQDALNKLKASQCALGQVITRIPELENAVDETQSAQSSKKHDAESLSTNNDTALQMLADTKQETERYKTKGQEQAETHATLCVSKQVLLGELEELRMEDSALDKAGVQKRCQLNQLIGSHELKGRELEQLLRGLNEAKKQYNTFHDQYIQMLTEMDC